MFNFFVKKNLTYLFVFRSRIATLWLQPLIMTHAAHLMSRPDIAEILSPILSFVDAKLMLLTAVQRLKGRVSLITGQISQANQEHKDITENTYVYQDPGLYMMLSRNIPKLKVLYF